MPSSFYGLKPLGLREFTDYLSNSIILSHLSQWYGVGETRNEELLDILRIMFCFNFCSSQIGLCLDPTMHQSNLIPTKFVSNRHLSFWVGISIACDRFIVQVVQHISKN